jgi:predicted FMN-binding regulatory protein PaiB
MGHIDQINKAIYRSSHSPEDISFAQDRGFGVLVVNEDAGPLLSHILFQLSPYTIYIEAHLVRSNQIWRALSEGPLSAVVAVSGGDSYVSPDWYDMPDRVLCGGASARDFATVAPRRAAWHFGALIWRV